MSDEWQPPEDHTLLHGTLLHGTPLHGTPPQSVAGDGSISGEQPRVPPEQPASGSAPVLEEGSRFGTFLIGPCIGQGGMARIYQAEHEGLQRQVALKVLLEGVGKPGDGHERFLREARIAAAIKHPNVVNIFDVGVHQGTPYLVMELLDGIDLDAFVELKGRLDEGIIMDIVVPIAGALAAVHASGVVHRDLKPGNIFLARGRNDEIEPRLLDFGISKSAGPDQLKLTSAGRGLIGTPFYMSPEAARGADMTPLSDQYALGVVLYECCTGVNPFASASSFAEIIHRITSGGFEPVAGQNPMLSRRMVGIVERAMQLDPARRFPDMRAMGRELLTLAGQRTRITWGLSFESMASSSARAIVPVTQVQAAPPAKSRRARYLIPAAFALALGGVALTLTPRQHVEVAARASAAAERPRSLDPGSPQTFALRAEASSAAPVGTLPEAELTALPPPPPPAEAGLAVAVTGALRDEPPPRRRRARSSRAEGKPRPAPAEADAPDWSGGRSRPVEAVTGLPRGTNNALILD